MTLGHTQHHRLDYLELGAPDLPRTKAFYATVFGWRFTDYGPGYAAILDANGAREVGGLDVGTTPSEGGPLVLVYSDDLDATEAAIIAAGGRIVTPTFAFPGGRRFVFADPAGNRLGAWSRD
ncbi:VOC family protein [Aeromicrobium sp.]|uniref:VOC family protein n=1 Tax=Aeromicrobium sp. TaxID=1871063 RepID=UPI0035193730